MTQCYLGPIKPCYYNNINDVATITFIVFQLPAKLCNDLNMMCARFWWGQCGDDKKIHWKSWESLVQPKKGEVWGLEMFEALISLCWRSKGGEC